MRLYVCVEVGWSKGGAVRARVVGMCMCMLHVYVYVIVHRLQREATAAWGGEAFRTEAHCVAVAPGVGVGAGGKEEAWVSAKGSGGGGAMCVWMWMWVARCGGAMRRRAAGGLTGSSRQAVAPLRGGARSAPSLWRSATRTRALPRLSARSPSGRTDPGRGLAGTCRTARLCSVRAVYMRSICMGECASSSATARR